MSLPAVHVRFVGMLSSANADALARACIAGLGSACGEVARWDVCLQPPLASACGSGYVVRAQACLNDGSVVSIRAQGDALEGTLRDAFDGIWGLLLQEGTAGAPQPSAWVASATPRGSRQGPQARQ